MNSVNGKTTINFNFLETDFFLPNRNILKVFIHSVFRKYQKKIKSVEVVFCSDEYLLNINKQFLKHDYYTDIITFNLAAPDQPIKAELYISIDRVTENARDLKESFLHELHRVLFHGVLHLCGLNDKTQEEKRIMRRTESALLNRYFGQ